MNAILSLSLSLSPNADAVDPGFHCVVTTHWIRGFMAFHLVRRTRIVMLMVLV